MYDSYQAYATCLAVSQEFGNMISFMRYLVRARTNTGDVLRILMKSPRTVCFGGFSHEGTKVYQPFTIKSKFRFARFGESFFAHFESSISTAARL